MKRYETIDVINGSKIVDYELPVIEYSESLVDKSHFIPTQEAVKRLVNAPPLSADIIETMYDYANGHDTGMNIPIGRKPGADLAEISQDIVARQNDINEKLKEGAKNYKIAQEIDKALKENVVTNKTTTENI